MATTVVNRHHGDTYDVYIGRGSIWGNPFPVTQGGREHVIRSYEDYLRGKPELLASLGDLHGKTLGCFCEPLPCHGDILAAFAESFTLTGAIPEASVSDQIFSGPKRAQLAFG